MKNACHRFAVIKDLVGIIRRFSMYPIISLASSPLTIVVRVMFGIRIVNKFLFPSDEGIRSDAGARRIDRFRDLFRLSHEIIPEMHLFLRITRLSHSSRPSLRDASTLVRARRCVPMRAIWSSCGDNTP
jgi:hypothetical protein